jgi:hypothetical protein
MSTRYQPMRLYRTAMILGAVLYAAAAMPLAAQQVGDSARVGVAAPANAAPASAAEASAPGTTAPGPRISPRFQSFAPSLERSSASATPSPMREGGSHTIVISTLALVLIIIIVVLLVR